MRREKVENIFMAVVAWTFLGASPDTDRQRGSQADGRKEGKDRGRESRPAAAATAKMGSSRGAGDLIKHLSSLPPKWSQPRQRAFVTRVRCHR